MNIMKKYYNFICGAVIVVSLLVTAFFGTKKQGYFIDENYTYTISNGTQLGISVDNGTWNDTAKFLGQVVSEGEENFSFGQMYQNAANDVHPPLYYVIFHFVSSVFTGVYSKWIGLGINLVLLLLTLMTVQKLAYRLSGENIPVTVMTLLFFGISPATISNAMLIRMYLLMLLWVLVYADLHVEDFTRDTLSVKKFLIPVFVTGFFGFLTQYFFIIVMFFISFAYAFYLLVFCGRIGHTIRYGCTVLASLIATVFVWPYSKFHIFGGYRGEGAMSQLLDVSQMLKRTSQYILFANDQVFGNLMSFYVIWGLIGAGTLIIALIAGRKAGGKDLVRNFSVPVKGMILLGFAAIMDFLVIAQIGLLGNENSCRHMFNAYGLFTLLIPIGTWMVAKHIFKEAPKRAAWALELTGAVLLITLLVGYASGQVLFLNESDGHAFDFAAAHPDEKVVMIHKDNGMYDSRIQDCVLYPEVYLVNAAEPEQVRDERVADADELLVYVSSQIKNQEECFEQIYEENPSISQAEFLWDCGNFFSVYLLH